jgi:hypothetical protein
MINPFGLALALALPLSTSSAERLQLIKPGEYFGMADASAAVAVNSKLFIAASDEDNILRVYRRDQGGPPVGEFDCNHFLELQGKSLEADLEGAARIGDRAFWIGSHGRNKGGKERPNRWRFFATDIAVTAGEVTLTPAGRPFKTLLQDLLSDPQLEPFRLAEASTRIPKEPEALNIEGLSATREGHLLLGFRNPIPGGKALLVPLLNPNQVIEGAHARFGPAIQLKLGGLGIRDMAFHEGGYIIIAGSYHGGGPFQVYRWKGPGSKPTPVKVAHLGDYTPEAIILYPDKGSREFQILSDDGNRLFEGVPGKAVADPGKRRFRSFWLTEE